MDTSEAKRRGYLKIPEQLRIITRPRIGNAQTNAPKPIYYRIGKNGCWNVVGRTPTKRGYFNVTRDNRRQYAHRLVYTLFVGEIPKGLLLRHRCDNTACINPEHLIPGTDADNANDAKLRRMGLPH